jgi:hypothetical protein
MMLVWRGATFGCAVRMVCGVRMVFVGRGAACAVRNMGVANSAGVGLESPRAASHSRRTAKGMSAAPVKSTGVKSTGAQTAAVETTTAVKTARVETTAVTTASAVEAATTVTTAAAMTTAATMAAAASRVSQICERRTHDRSRKHGDKHQHLIAGF